MKLVIKITLFTSLFALLNSCESTFIEPIDLNGLVPYMSLNIGDIRQYYDEAEGAYIQYEVVDTTRRVDGQKVFKMKNTLFMPDGFNFRAILYYFIKDNFFIATRLDTVTDYPQDQITNTNRNKFNEQKLAKIFPRNGDYFLRNETYADSQKFFFKISIIDSLITNCGKFKNVAQYEVIDSEPDWNLLIYYAPYYGNIGSVLENKYGKSKIFAAYIKANNKEICSYTKLHFGEWINIRSKK